MDPIEFTDNYEDLSTDKGFQFKFACERCGNGYLSTYKVSTLGVAGGLLDAASSLLGGIFGQAVDSAYEVQRAVGGKAHDEALREAVKELRPRFAQCRQCGQWVCRDVCFHAGVNMCKDCAPVAEEHETSARAQQVREQVANDLALEEEERVAAKARQVKAKCKKCGQPTGGAKFCPNCGTRTGDVPQFCPSCKAKAAPGAKFCGECGTAL